jgi:nucleoside-diphosphate-sugar epimerase
MTLGHQVIVVDNFFTGSKNNLQRWHGHPNFDLYTHDVVESVQFEVDEIYHLACPSAPVHYQVTKCPLALIASCNVKRSCSCLGKRDQDG